MMVRTSNNAMEEQDHTGVVGSPNKVQLIFQRLSVSMCVQGLLGGSVSCFFHGGRRICYLSFCFCFLFLTSFCKGSFFMVLFIDP